MSALPRRPAVALIALLAIGLVLGSGFVAIADSHGPISDSSPSWGALDTQPDLHTSACSACLLRAQLEGSDLSPLPLALDEGAPGAPLRAYPAQYLSRLASPNLLPRGPPSLLAVLA